MDKSIAQHKLELARELLDDLELSRLTPEQSLLKTSRLARLVEDRETLQWVTWELGGYENTAAAIPWMVKFGRFTNPATQQGYWMPLAGIEGSIAAIQTQLQAPPLSNVPPYQVLSRLQNLTAGITTLTSVRSKVLAAAHAFAVRVYHELAFSGLAETIFEGQKSRVDGLLNQHAPDVVEMIPSVYDRLAEGDDEALSQAMNTLRRMIGAFADTVYPPSKGSRELGGEKYEIGTDKVLNRIKLYLHDKCPSKSRADRLSQAIRSIYERASAGSHNDISPDEARSLFVLAYLNLGEMLEATTPVA